MNFITEINAHQLQAEMERFGGTFVYIYKYVYCGVP